ncbi:MAG: UDP-N-acetylmuramate--L-alanine ligase [Eubacteriales bacterium]
MRIDDIIAGTHVHLVGIGGVSMSALAEVLHQKGVIVSGSDGARSSTLDHLVSLGIKIFVGHSAKQVESDVACLIRSAAIGDENPEVVEALSRHLDVFARAEAWGWIMKGYENALCVAGTHGKTTTTAMSAEIFLTAQHDPTVMIGGVLPSMGASHRTGKGDTIIVESCEYCNSFHHFFPTVAVLLNIDEDHVDFFDGLDQIKASFSTFLKKVPPDGKIFVCGDDPIALEVASSFPHYMVGLEKGDVCTSGLVWKNGYPTFSLIYLGLKMGEITLKVAGEHNLRNALAAAGTALYLGVDFRSVAEGLGKFTGAGRRFERKGRYHGVEVIDDYAHHPTEIAALLSAVRKLDYNRIFCVFQPHTYTRTKAFFSDFVSVLSGGEIVILLDIYAAREPFTKEISSQMLADYIPNSRYFSDREDAISHLKQVAEQGDLILTIGAGDVYLVGEQLVENI